MDKLLVDEWLSRWFLIGGFISSDTYKRTMWSSTNKALLPASYHLTLRRPLEEKRSKRRFVMSGHEWLLRQWFGKPFSRRGIEETIEWYLTHSNVKKFPVTVFQKILADQTGDDIYLPIDVYGFPGGQTFLSGVPCLRFDGIGGLVSFIEPAMCRYYGAIIHSTKSRILSDVTYGDHAEFGYRCDPCEIMSIAKLLSIYIGNGGKKVFTSTDIAERMFPEYFQSIGTIGHEYIQAYQDLSDPSMTLTETEAHAMWNFLVYNDRMSAVTDTTHLAIGIEALKRVASTYKNEAIKEVGFRCDSGEDKAELCVETWRLLNKAAKYRVHPIVVESEMNPDEIENIRNYFATRNLTLPISGLGGYFYKDFHRDTVSAAFKRSMTNGQPNIKFSEKGKESIPGKVCVYIKDTTLVVADESEDMYGKPLYVKLVDQGRIVNPEDMNFQRQAQRCINTWNTVEEVEMSTKIKHWIEIFTAKKDFEVSILEGEKCQD